MTPTRRQFLTYLGLGTYSLLRSSPVHAAFFPLRRRRPARPTLFGPIRPSGFDRVIVPKGFRYDRVITWGDALGSTGPLGPEHFGYDNDFLCYFPLTKEEGLLWVNHESVVSLFVSDFSEGQKTREQVQKERLAVGGSVLQIRRGKEGWRHVPGSKYTKRFTAAYPQIAMTGPVAAKVPQCRGTLANCSGGKTPWNTVLSCEENFKDFNPKSGHDWAAFEDTKLDEHQYGWVVEIDPLGELPPQKHSSLGRFAHENAAMIVSTSGKLVVYMGDDDQDQFVYKFVSREKYDPKASRAERRKLLTDGTLYAADFVKGKWLPLDLEQSPALKEEGFASQADVLLDTRRAASALKATPVDRPEDCEIHPRDGSIYIALTNNLKHGNLYGQIVRLVENDDNHDGTSFRFELFLAGGPQSGLASPDNLLFDNQANLWVSCDVSSGQLNRGGYERFMNNGLFMVPTLGPSAGDAFQFASAPNEAEFTGPWFTDDFSTLFLSVQHPGEKSINAKSPTSRWPEGGTSIPRPAVIAITGF